MASDPHVVFDVERMMACQYPTDCSVHVRNLPLDCLPPGRSPPGARCVFHEACASGECDGLVGSCGTCAAPSAACDCAPNQVCTGFDADGAARCETLAPIGAACTIPGSCVSYCSFAAGVPGTCVALAALGEPCGDGVGASPGRAGPPCASSSQYCDATLHCSPIVGASYGAECGVVPGDGGALMECSGYGTCDPTSFVCISPAPDGEVCDETQGLGCLPPADCISNRCLYPSLSNCGQ